LWWASNDRCDNGPSWWCFSGDCGRELSLRLTKRSIESLPRTLPSVCSRGFQGRYRRLAFSKPPDSHISLLYVEYGDSSPWIHFDAFDISVYGFSPDTEFYNFLHPIEDFRLEELLWVNCSKIS
jgi:hypothetical protein